MSKTLDKLLKIKLTYINYSRLQYIYMAIDVLYWYCTFGSLFKEI